MYKPIRPSFLNLHILKMNLDFTLLIPTYYTSTPNEYPFQGRHSRVQCQVNAGLFGGLFGGLSDCGGWHWIRKVVGEKWVVSGCQGVGAKECESEGS